jgi:hypothetical protein
MKQEISGMTGRGRDQWGGGEGETDREMRQGVNGIPCPSPIKDKKRGTYFFFMEIMSRSFCCIHL